MLLAFLLSLIMDRAPDSFLGAAAASLFATLVIESAAKENTICDVSSHFESASIFTLRPRIAAARG